MHEGNSLEVSDIFSLGIFWTLEHNYVLYRPLTLLPDASLPTLLE